MSISIDRARTEGTFSLDGGTWEVENNVWVIGDDQVCVVIDPAHDLEAVAQLVGGRRVSAVLLTHAHDDHAKLALSAAERFEAPVLLNPREKPLWDLTHPQRQEDPGYVPLSDGQRIPLGSDSQAELVAVATPGHSPGSTCFYSPDLSWEGRSPVVFSGDTLFEGGPGATGRSYSDYATILASIRERLFVLPEQTVVLTGHGDPTTIGAEAAASTDWEDPSAS